MASVAKRQRLHAKSVESDEATISEKRDSENVDYKLRTFLKWCEHSRFDVNEKVTVARQGSCHNYGLVAVEDIAEGETLFTVPREVLLHPANCSISALLEQGQNELRSDSGWVPLLLCLMTEYTKPDSKWRPYLDICPDFAHLDPPMFWDREMITRDLRGTGVPELSDRDARNVRHEYTAVAVPFMKKNPQQFDLAVHTLELYRQMVAFVMAYSFTEPRRPPRKCRGDAGDDGDEDDGDEDDGDCNDADDYEDEDDCNDNKDGDDGNDDNDGDCGDNEDDDDNDCSDANDDDNNDDDDDDDDDNDNDNDDDCDNDDYDGTDVPAVPMMVPMADILNHIAKNNARLQFGKTSLRMIATKNIHKNEEVFNTYGELANWQLLHMYGFAEPYPENIYDTVDLPVILLRDQSESCLDGEAAFTRAKWEFIGGRGEEFTDAVVVGYDGIMNKYETYDILKVLSLSPDEFEKHQARLDGGEAVDGEEWMTIEENLEDFFSFDGLSKLPTPWTKLLTASAKEHTKTYRGTLTEDLELLRDLGTADGRLKYALHVRIGQRKLLERLVHSAGGLMVQTR